MYLNGAINIGPPSGVVAFMGFSSVLGGVSLVWAWLEKGRQRTADRDTAPHALVRLATFGRPMDDERLDFISILWILG